MRREKCLWCKDKAATMDAAEERAVPTEFMCPITLSLMSHPTTGSVAGGARRVAFERRAIERWRDECRAVGRSFCDPTTNMPMSASLEPDALLVSMIRSYFAACCASCDAEAEELARRSAAPVVARLVYDSRAEALAAELRRVGCFDAGRRIQASKEHRDALRGLARERGIAPLLGDTQINVQHASRTGRRFKARAVSPGTQRLLSEVRVRCGLCGVLTVQHFHGDGRVGAALLAYLIGRYELAPSALRVGGVSGSACYALRRLGVACRPAAACMQRLREELSCLNVAYGVLATRVAWLASPMWASERPR